MSEGTAVVAVLDRPPVEVLDVTPPPAANPVVVYLRRLGPGSRGSILSSLRQILEVAGAPDVDPFVFPWWRLTYVETSAVRAALAERYAPATANRALSALRGVLKESWRLGHMTNEQMARAGDVAAVKGSRLPAGRHVENGEQRALFAVCAADRSPAGRRDAAVLGIGFGGGLRRAEISGLVGSDWDPITGRLRVMGKGSKERSVPLSAGARRYLEDWLEVRGDRDPLAPLILRVGKGGTVDGRGLSGAAILSLLTRRAAEAGIPECKPHDWRRTYVGDHLDGGTDLATVQALAGHANVATTARYDRRGARARDAASNNILTPYVAPVAS